MKRPLLWRVMQMRIQKTTKQKHKEFDFPVPMYFIAKFFHKFPRLADMLHTVEYFQLKKKVEKISIDRPIYVTGFARAGTTITVEMLSHHPDVATHRYLHMVLPFTPHWTQQVANYAPLMTKPVERVHQDGLLVTKESPEAVEEIFWQRFFENPHDEANSNILDRNTKNPQFEIWYRTHLKKLLYDQHATRYAAKNNYNITRMEYLQKLFPNVKFIILIRNPFNHIASLAKQDRVLKEVEQKDSLLLDWTKIIGHREFGSARVCINLDNYGTVQKIRQLWTQKNTYVEGWAVYWAAMYSYIHRKLETNPDLAKASLLVRYEDLCESPKKTIDDIIDHTELDSKKFEKIKEHYSKRLRQPTYYKSKYSEKEQDTIIHTTKEIAGKFGYDL